MNKAETNRFNELYQRHLRLLKLQGMAPKTIDAYSLGLYVESVDILIVARSIDTGTTRRILLRVG